MITIDRLRLTLPAGFEGRADAVARRVARELADLPELPPTASRRLARLTLPPLTLDPALGDGIVARRIATALHERLSAPEAVSDAGPEARAVADRRATRNRGGDRP